MSTLFDLYMIGLPVFLTLSIICLLIARRKFTRQRNADVNAAHLAGKAAVQALIIQYLLRESLGTRQRSGRTSAMLVAAKLLAARGEKVIVVLNNPMAYRPLWEDPNISFLARGDTNAGALRWDDLRHISFNGALLFDHQALDQHLGYPFDNETRATVQMVEGLPVYQWSQTPKGPPHVPSLAPHGIRAGIGKTGVEHPGLAAIIRCPVCRDIIPSSTYEFAVCPNCAW